MQTRLILVEGIPGSGKSTIAQRIAEHYRKKEHEVHLYLEGDYHPADLAWQAYLSPEQFHQILERYGGMRDALLQHSHREGEHILLPYTKIKSEDIAFYREMEGYELYHRRVPPDVFCSVHQHRWQSFGERACQSTDLHIFECAYLQNQLTQLLYFHQENIEVIRTYLCALIASSLPLQPLLIYLSQTDIRTTIERVAVERIGPQGRWLDSLIEFTENTPYARAKHRKGLEGALQCLEDRKCMELAIIPTLPLQSHVIDNPDYHWQELWCRVESVLP